MNILCLSRAWPPFERSGVSLAALLHVEILLKLGHKVTIIGSSKGLDEVSLGVEEKITIEAEGSGAIYSPVRINKDNLKKIFLDINPDLVIVEAWQTALTDTGIEIAFHFRMPILMISHGISLHPHDKSIMQIIRSFAWLPYKLFKLPKLIKKLSAITTLDKKIISDRFYDRDVAEKYGIKIFELKNCPINYYKNSPPRSLRENKILVIGYFSPIKNQLAALNILLNLPEKFKCHFIGDRKGTYYELCNKTARLMDLEKRVYFSQDNEVDIRNEIANSLIVYMPSLTEALPITLIEAMASGTPFVANSVGAIPSMSGGISCSQEVEQLEALLTLINNSDIWEKYSYEGRRQYANEFNLRKIQLDLSNIVNSVQSNQSPYGL